MLNSHGSEVAKDNRFSRDGCARSYRSLVNIVSISRITSTFAGMSHFTRSKLNVIRIYAAFGSNFGASKHSLYYDVLFDALSIGWHLCQ